MESGGTEIDLTGFPNIQVYFGKCIFRNPSCGSHLRSTQSIFLMLWQFSIIRCDLDRPNTVIQPPAPSASPQNCEAMDSWRWRSIAINAVAAVAPTAVKLCNQRQNSLLMTGKTFRNKLGEKVRSPPLIPNSLPKKVESCTI